jgi:hypothetical protein
MKVMICTVFGNRVLRILLGTETEEVIREGGDVSGVGKEGRAGRTEGRTEICAKSWSVI